MALMSASMSPMGMNVRCIPIVLVPKSTYARHIGIFAPDAILRKPECHLVVRLRVPSGVSASTSRSLSLYLFTMVSTKELFFPFRGTGMPPMALNILPRGKKNQDSFIKNPDLRFTERMANSQRIKSQLLVCGATQIMHLGYSGTSTLTFHPAHFKINRLRFMLIAISRRMSIC